MTRWNGPKERLDMARSTDASCRDLHELAKSEFAAVRAAVAGNPNAAVEDLIDLIPVESLGRNVPANMAMVPFSSKDASLIVVQSPSAHPMNGDEERMRRVLVHELCHALVRERTGSRQMFGDGMRDFRVRPWLDEDLEDRGPTCC